MTTKKKTKKAAPKPANKPKAIYFTLDMANDLARIRKVRTDARTSDSVLIADAMKAYATAIECQEEPCLQ